MAPSPSDAYSGRLKGGRVASLLLMVTMLLPLLLQIHEKEEEEFNEKSENDSGINEEPLLTADQV